MTSQGHGDARASDEDREAATSWLTTAFVQGRLTKDELDERMGLALSARTHAELQAVTADLPGATPAATAPAVPAAPRTNPLAIASLACGIGQVVIPPVPTILAIVFGVIARRQIRRSGGVERGYGLATAGLVLGWLAVALLVVGLVAVAAANPGVAHPG